MLRNYTTVFPYFKKLKSLPITGRGFSSRCKTFLIPIIKKVNINKFHKPLNKVRKPSHQGKKSKPKLAWLQFILEYNDSYASSGTRGTAVARRKATQQSRRIVIARNVVTKQPRTRAPRHCEERSDEATPNSTPIIHLSGLASLRSGRRFFFSFPHSRVCRGTMRRAPASRSVANYGNQ